MSTNFNYSDPEYLQDKIEGMQLDIASLKSYVEKLTAERSKGQGTANNRSDEIAFLETLFAITHCKSEIDRVLNARIAQLRAVR